MAKPIDWGIRDSQSIVVQQRIRITNVISIIVATVGMVLTVLDIANGYSNFLIYDILIGIIFLIPIALNRLHHPTTAQFTLTMLFLLAIISDGIMVDHSSVYRFYLLLPIYLTFQFFYAIHTLLFRVSMGLIILTLITMHVDLYHITSQVDPALEIGYWSFIIVSFSVMLVSARAQQSHDQFITIYRRAAEETANPLAMRYEGKPYFYRNPAHIKQFPITGKQVWHSQIFGEDLAATIDDEIRDAGSYETMFTYQVGDLPSNYMLNAYHVLAAGKKVIVESSQDITEMHQLTNSLQLANKSLEEIVANKDRFFSILAHDLRSPITSMLSITRILQDQPNLPAEKVASLHNMLWQSNEKTLQLLDSLLTWSKLQRGQMKPEMDVSDLSDIAQDAAETAHQAASSKGVHLVIENGSPVNLLMDKTMIQTAVRNLVSNAVKYCHSGDTVTIATHLSDHTAYVSVKDTGIGMSEEKLLELRSHKEITSTAGTRGEVGTAIGLGLVREFIRIHNGQLNIHSVEGEGSEFVIELPVTEQ